MAITVNANFIAQLKAGNNSPNCVIEIALDSGVLKYGYSSDTFSDVIPILKTISPLQNKIDSEKGYTTRGQMSFTITGRENFKNLIKNNYLKNRIVNRKEGFIGLAYTDYISTFIGKIFDWQRKEDELTITVADILMQAAIKKIPIENATKTQYAIYSNLTPTNAMLNILSTAGINTTSISTASFANEESLWLQGWTFDRVLTESKPANEYLNELQQETNSFIFDDGAVISYKVFAPAIPGQTIEEYTDNFHILSGSLSHNSGYKNNFYNRILIYYDYDESGDDESINYESLHIATDAASQSTSQWNETKTKEIKSRWIRTNTFSQPSNITGCIIYHCSYNNGAGSGTLTYNNANKTLTWTPPGATIGATVNITKDGKYQIFGADATKWIRVIVIYASLSGSNQVDTINLTALNVNNFVAQLAQKILNRYRNPVSEIKYELDINNIAWNNQFIQPTNLKDITTDEVAIFGSSSWAQKRVMLTNIKPDFEKHKISIEAIETSLNKRYGFIAPAGLPDYTSASAAQKEYGFIGNSSNQVNAGTEEGYIIWVLPWLFLTFLQIAQMQVFI